MGGFGVKTNERPGTRAQVKYSRVSAYKAREVLDLIRGKHVADADDILAFVDRDVAMVIRKCLASAVANAATNDQLDPETLHISACYADEGPTLKRWRPRARGRGHPHPQAHLPHHGDREPPRRPGPAHLAGQGRQAGPVGCLHATSRWRRRRPPSPRSQEPPGRGRRHDPALRRSPASPTRDAIEAAEEAAETGATTEEAQVPGEPTEETVDAAESADDAAGSSAYGEHSHAPLDNGDAPEGFEIKGNEDSMKYHVPGSRWYDQTEAEVWFDTAEAAEAQGFVPAGGADEQETDTEGEA